MSASHSFRFAEDGLNRRLITLLKRNRIRHSVEENGVIHYSRADEESVENDLINSIRSRVFSSWQVVSCPKEFAERYTRYMRQHDIPFKEELADGQSCFLLPRRYRPHQWKLDEEAAPLPRP
jgi:hypothetical protein